MSAVYIYLDNDFYVFTEDTCLASDPGTFLDSQTVTWVLYQSDKTTTVSSGTAAYTSGSNGDYLGTIPASVTSGLTVGSTYWVKITSTGGGKGVWWVQCTAALRTS